MNLKPIKNKSKSIAILAIAFFILAPLLSLAPASAAVSADRFYITNTAGEEEWTLQPSAIGTIITVQLRIEGASPIWGWAVEEVTWNPDVLQYVSASEGNFLRGGSADEYIYETQSVRGSVTADNPGVLAGGIAAAIVGDYQQTDGDGILATMRFRIVGAGNANIHIDTPVLVETYRTNPEPHPELAADPTLVIGNPFVVPEYALGGLAALGVAFAAFFVVKKVHVPTFSKHI